MDGSRDIQGYGGGGESSGQQGSVESPDNLQSIAYARVLDLWGEGELQGFVHPTNVLQDLALNGTPVANADGSLNFKNVKFDSRSGSQSQSFMSGFPDVENETSVGVELKSSTPWTQTITNLQLTAVRVRLSMPSIQKSDTTTGDITGYTVQYAIDLKTDSGEYQQCIASSFTGKSTSKYERAHRIDLPAATTGWTVRVRRLTANANLATVADTTTVESYTEITDGKFRYPNSAYGGLIVDASQFSSIPTRAFYMYGRIVSVPSNYNPTTRVYTGAWDGTFKPAWTNNPAWIFYDLVTNPRFGLGEYCPASLVNKWALYTIAQYCDGMVSDGFGGTEPRMTCNVFLQTQAEAYKVMQDLASVFRGIIYWAGGAIQAVADMPGDPVYTYTAANVVDGEFTYQGSGRKTRYTVALVSWNDQTDFGRAKVEYVSDDEGIARYGVQPVEVTAFGCTSRAQAHRVGLWTLYTSRLETGTVTFKVGLDGTLCAPGQIIRVSDPARAGKRQAGRIHSATATAITVDNAPTVAVGDAITCALPNGITETHAVTAVSGRVISVASPGFSIAPQAESVWVVESSTLVAETYRVVSVLDDSSGDEISYTITALQHNASKFDAIDFGDALMVPPVSVIPPSSQVGPASVTLSSNETAGTVLASILLSISWPATANAVRYQCEWRKDNGEWQTLGDHLKGLSADIHNAKPGTYYARVRAFNANGIGSVPTLSDPLVIADQSKQPTKLTDLKTEVDDAAQQAQIANAELAQIADDSLLSPPEKPTVERDYSVITTEQAGIDAQATAYGITTEKTAYDNAVSALTSYLVTLTAPVAWNDKSGYTDIVGATFKAKFTSVYTTRQTLLNKIYATAKGLADTAQGTADDAKTAADSNQPLIINPYFTTGDLTGWTSDSGGWIFQSGSNGPSSSTSYAKRTGSSAHPNEAIRNAAQIPVYPGAVIKAQCAVRGYNSPNGTCGVRISWRDSSDTELSTTAGNTTTGNGTNGTFVTATAPAGAMFAHVECAANGHTAGSYSVDNFAASLLADSMDQVPDGTTRFAAAEAGADKTSNNPQAQAWLTDHANIVNASDSITRLGGRTLVNIADGGGRYAAVEAGADKTAGKSLDVLADGTNYRRTGAGYVDSSGRVTKLFDGTTIRDAGTIWDGANRARTGLDSSGVLADGFHPLTRLTGRTLDNIGDSGSRFAAINNATTQAQQAAQIAASYQPGQNIVPNPSFAVGAAQGNPLGWILVQSSNIDTTVLVNEFAFSTALKIAVVATGSGETAISVSNRFPLPTTGVISAQCRYDIDRTLATGDFSADVEFHDSAGNLVARSGRIFTASAATDAPLIARLENVAIPAGTTQGRIRVFAENASESAGAVYLRATDFKVEIGASCTPFSDYATNYGNNLVVPGSGQALGDQRNAPSSLTRNLGIVRSATALTAHSGGAVDVNAHTITMGAASIAYNAKANAVTGLNTGNSYYIYTRDNYAGGSPTYAATANSGTVNGYDDAYNAGVVTIPSSGTSGGGGGGLGPGVPCVCADMWLRPGLRARDLAERWRWWKPWLWCLQGPDGWHLVRRRPRVVPYQACRVTVADGTTLDCSIGTPVTTATGESVLAPMLHGEFVATDSGWQRVINVELIPGSRDVVRINCGGNSFFAGTDPYRRISSHNEYKP